MAIVWLIIVDTRWQPIECNDTLNTCDSAPTARALVRHIASGIIFCSIVANIAACDTFVEYCDTNEMRLQLHEEIGAPHVLTVLSCSTNVRVQAAALHGLANCVILEIALSLFEPVFNCMPCVELLRWHFVVRGDTCARLHRCW